VHARGALAARRALAAALAPDELQELGDVDHAGALVHDDQPPRAHHGAELLQGADSPSRVEVLVRDAAAAGTADLHGLDAVAGGGAAADVVDDLAQGDAAGTSTRPVLRTRRRGEDLVPAASPYPRSRNHSAPWSITAGTLASVSTLLTHRGAAVQALTAGYGGEDAACRAASMLAGIAVSSPQTKAPRAHVDGDVEVGERAEDVAPEQPAARHWRMASRRRSIASGYSARQ